MEVAELVASWSKDPSTKTGAIVVGPDREIRATGYNGLVRGVNDDVPERLERPTKYDFFEHAERNAIYNACLTGTSLKGCVMLQPTLLAPTAAGPLFSRESGWWSLMRLLWIKIRRKTPGVTNWAIPNRCLEKPAWKLCICRTLKNSRNAPFKS